MTENAYQAKLTKKIKRMFPGCVLLKNDAAYQQGILDWTILYEDKWASLEVKASADAVLQANQEFFVHKLNDMSFAAVIYPENEAEVLGALQQAFAIQGRTCVLES